MNLLADWFKLVCFFSCLRQNTERYIFFYVGVFVLLLLSFVSSSPIYSIHLIIFIIIWFIYLPAILFILFIYLFDPFVIYLLALPVCLNCCCLRVLAFSMLAKFKFLKPVGLYACCWLKWSTIETAWIQWIWILYWISLNVFFS